MPRIAIINMSAWAYDFFGDENVFPSQCVTEWTEVTEEELRILNQEADRLGDSDNGFIVVEQVENTRDFINATVGDRLAEIREREAQKQREAAAKQAKARAAAEKKRAAAEEKERAQLAKLIAKHGAPQPTLF